MDSTIKEFMKGVSKPSPASLCVCIITAVFYGPLIILGVLNETQELIGLITFSSIVFTSILFINMRPFANKAVREVEAHRYAPDSAMVKRSQKPQDKVASVDPPVRTSEKPISELDSAVYAGACHIAELSGITIEEAQHRLEKDLIERWESDGSNNQGVVPNGNTKTELDKIVERMAYELMEEANIGINKARTTVVESIKCAWDKRKLKKNVEVEEEEVEQ